MAARDSGAPPSTPRVLRPLDPGAPPGPAASSGGLRPYRRALVLALLLGGLIAAAWAAGSPILEALGEAADTAARGNTQQARWVLTVVAVALAVLGFVIAWGAATSPRRPVRLSGSRGRMAVDEIAQRVRQDLVARADVRDARIVVANRHRHGLRVQARLRVDAAARIAEVIDAVDAVAEALIEDRLGVPLDGVVDVDVHYDELDLRAGHAHG